ncbi:MAG TPA: hypothetical protein VFG12_11020 [Rhodopila sp.]|jgi:hypothetical protein|nr:hypothetical protein [Rhodopila sp.]
MPIEVRYLMFSPEETRQAMTTFAIQEGYAATQDDVLALTIAGGHDPVSATLEVRAPIRNKSIRIDSDRLVGALLLYCSSRKIPIPRRAQKMFETTADGLTMVLTTDLAKNPPVVVGDHITYSSIANYAEEARQARRERALAIARSESAEAMLLQANAKAEAAESAAAELAAQLAAIRLDPGLRARLGRWLMLRSLDK